MWQCYIFGNVTFIARIHLLFNLPLSIYIVYQLGRPAISDIKLSLCAVINASITRVSSIDKSDQILKHFKFITTRLEITYIGTPILQKNKDQRIIFMVKFINDNIC